MQGPVNTVGWTALVRAGPDGDAQQSCALQLPHELLEQLRLAERVQISVRRREFVR